MKILNYIHGYPPQHNAGAEWMSHRINKKLTALGHEVRVVVAGWDGPRELDGVVIMREHDVPNKDHFIWADVVMSHLDRVNKAMNICRFYRKPLLFVSHNSHDYGTIRIRPKDVYIIYNSEWVAKELEYPQPGIVVRPPVFVEEFTPKPTAAYPKRTDGYITLVNLWENKGGKILQELARAMPDRKFMGVKGGYGEQEVDLEIPNIKYVENGPDIKKILKQTRILIMPSKYESWGLIAVEAMASRIPVIAHPTIGLLESLGDAGIFVERDYLDQWTQAIEDLDGESIYNEACKAAYKRARGLDPMKDIKSLERFMEEILEGKYVNRYEEAI